MPESRSATSSEVHVVSAGTSAQHVLTYCPRCGSKGFSPPDDPGMHPAAYFLCTRCGFEFFLNAAASTAALIEREPGLLLMTRRLKEPEQGKLDLPGGFVDLRERAEDTVCREIWEECRLRIVRTYLVNRTYWNSYVYGGFTYHTLDLVFRCEVASWDSLISTDGSEVETLLIRKGEIDLDAVGLSSVRRIVGDYIEGNI